MLRRLKGFLSPLLLMPVRRNPYVFWFVLFLEECKYSLAGKKSPADFSSLDPAASHYKVLQANTGTVKNLLHQQEDGSLQQ